MHSANWFSVPVVLEGQSVAPGLTIGIAHCHQSFTATDVPRVFSVTRESLRLKKAFERLSEEIAHVRVSKLETFGADFKEIIDAYALMAADPSWQKRLAKIVEDGYSCEHAIDAVLCHYQDKFLSYPFWQQRLQDFKDLSDRLKRHLQKAAAPVLPATKHANIVFAKTLSIGDLLTYMRQRLGGLVLEEASPTSHVMILARSLMIPIVRVENATQKVESGTIVVVDSDQGKIFVKPELNLLYTLQRRLQNKAVNTAPPVYAACVQTRDGQQIKLHMNANLPQDLDLLDQSAFSGVGLLRTELLFAASPDFPTLKEQETCYRDLFEKAKDKRVCIRTFDIAPDKIPAQWAKTLGISFVKKGIVSVTRFARDWPHLFDAQIRALLRAKKAVSASLNPLHITLPMIADVETFQHQKKRILDLAAEEGIRNDFVIRVGAMLEIPSLLYQLEDLYKVADYVSLGSNDLYQLFFGEDRAHYRPFLKSFLKALREIIKLSVARQIDLTVCGDMASRPAEAMVLLGLGVRQLSVSSETYAALYRMIETLPVKTLELSLECVLGDSRVFDKTKSAIVTTSLESYVQAFIHEQGIAV